jgi:hypothetical protein
MRRRALLTAGLVVLAVIPLVNLALAYWVPTNSKVNLRIKQRIVGLFSAAILILLAVFVGAGRVSRSSCPSAASRSWR